MARLHPLVARRVVAEVGADVPLVLVAGRMEVQRLAAALAVDRLRVAGPRRAHVHAVDAALVGRAGDEDAVGGGGARRVRADDAVELLHQRRGERGGVEEQRGEEQPADARDEDAHDRRQQHAAERAAEARHPAQPAALRVVRRVLLLIPLQQPFDGERDAEDDDHEQRPVGHEDVEAVELEREVVDHRGEVEQLQRVQAGVERAERGRGEPIEEGNDEAVAGIRARAENAGGDPYGPLRGRRALVRVRLLLASVRFARHGSLCLDRAALLFCPQELVRHFFFVRKSKSWGPRANRASKNAERRVSRQPPALALACSHA